MVVGIQRLITIPDACLMWEAFFGAAPMLESNFTHSVVETSIILGENLGPSLEDEG